MMFYETYKEKATEGFELLVEMWGGDIYINREAHLVRLVYKESNSLWQRSRPDGKERYLLQKEIDWLLDFAKEINKAWEEDEMDIWESDIAYLKEMLRFS